MSQIKKLHICRSSQGTSCDLSGENVCKTKHDTLTRNLSLRYHRFILTP